MAKKLTDMLPSFHACLPVGVNPPRMDQFLPVTNRELEAVCHLLNSFQIWDWSRPIDILINNRADATAGDG